MINDKQYKALKVVAKKLEKNGSIRAYEFALDFWGKDLDKEYLFTSVSNQGDYGACSGKKAWRCGGAYLGRLVKMGLLRRVGFYYYISQKGKDAVNEYEKVKGIKNETE